MSDDCCLCAQISGQRELDLLHEHLGGVDYYRRLAELGGGWYAIPSIGSLVAGHTLLCPGRHARSFASLDPAEIADLDPRLAQLTERLAGNPDDVVQLFEHGNAKTGMRVACSVEHAHLHVVPAAPDLWPHIDQSIEWTLLSDGLMGLAAAVGAGEYLLYRDLDARCWISHAPEQGHPSQIMRRALAAAIGEPEQWNWRAHPRLRDTAASLRAVAAGA